jgi:hypothetical protein
MLKEKNDRTYDSMFEFVVFPYLVSLRDKDERMYVIDWLIGVPELRDARQFVSNAFHAHSKDVPPKVFPLIENTEIILRYILYRRKKFKSDADKKGAD